MHWGTQWRYQFLLKGQTQYWILLSCKSTSWKVFLQRLLVKWMLPLKKKVLQWMANWIKEFPLLCLLDGCTCMHMNNKTIHFTCGNNCEGVFFFIVSAARQVQDWVVKAWFCCWHNYRNNFKRFNSNTDETAESLLRVLFSMFEQAFASVAVDRRVKWRTMKDSNRRWIQIVPRLCCQRQTSQPTVQGLFIGTSDSSLECSKR